MVVWVLFSGDLIAFFLGDTSCVSIWLSYPVPDSDFWLQMIAISFIHIINLFQLIGYGLLLIPSRDPTPVLCEP